MVIEERSTIKKMRTITSPHIPNDFSDFAGYTDGLCVVLLRSQHVNVALNQSPVLSITVSLIPLWEPLKSNYMS